MMNAVRNIRLVLVAAVAAMAAFAAFAQNAAAQNTPSAEKAQATDAKKDSQSDKKYKPLAEARAKIGDVIQNPALMAEILGELSPEDQRAFVADVNAAISKLPGSVEDKTAKFLNVNRAALKGAAPGNMANILAVTFASVPPESLTVLSERFATDLFNRDADPSHKFTDEAFEKTATEVIGKVVQATAGSDDEGVRNVLAVLMFLRASNASIDGLEDRLVATLPNSEIRELATKEWIPAAMAAGNQKSYDAMLAYADAGKAPNIIVVLNLAGPQILDAVLMDLTTGILDHNKYQTAPILEQLFIGDDIPNPLMIDTTGLGNNIGGNAVPRTTDPTKPWNPDYKRDDPKPEPTPPVPPPYPYTNM